MTDGPRGSGTPPASAPASPAGHRRRARVRPRLRRLLPRGRWTRLIALGAIVGTGALFTITGPANAALPGPPSGWTQVFADDFNGAAGSGIDGQWMYDT